jgi:hypothetical protein
VSDRLPRPIRALIRDHVHSVGELDLLMLLHVQRDRTWSTEELCAALGAPVGWVTLRLQPLQAAGLVTQDGEDWRTCPQSAPQRDALDSLAGLYRSRRRDLVQYIFAQTPGSSPRSARRT